MSLEPRFAVEAKWPILRTSEHHDDFAARRERSSQGKTCEKHRPAGWDIWRKAIKVRIHAGRGYTSSFSLAKPVCTAQMAS